MHMRYKGYSSGFNSYWDMSSFNLEKNRRASAFAKCRSCYQYKFIWFTELKKINILYFDRIFFMYYLYLYIQLRERLLQEIVTNQKALLNFQPLTAEFTSTYVQAGEVILKALSSQKIIPLSEIFSTIDLEKLSKLLESTNSAVAVLKHLQSKV